MHCVHTIKTELSEIAGIRSVDADATGKTAVITFEPPATEDQIKSLLAEIDYPVAA